MGRAAFAMLPPTGQNSTMLPRCVVLSKALQCAWQRTARALLLSRQQAQKKTCWDFVHALVLEILAAWLQAGGDRAIAAGSTRIKK
jgi:hypothetical protein